MRSDAAYEENRFHMSSPRILSTLLSRSKILTSTMAVAATVLAGLTLTTGVAAATPAQEITWEACPEQVNDQAAQCGRIDVPMYHSDPAGKQISVGFVHVPAANQDAKRGTLFGNSGGPGGDAYSYFGHTEAFSWPEGIVNEWDRVAVQPRGLPGSTPVDCAHTPANFSPVDMYLRQGAFIKESCEVGTPGYTASLTTDNTADDWEWVRSALDVDQLSVMGLSYGTFLGSVYASRYPEHTDRVVLDSGMDPNLAWNGIMGSQQAGYENSLHDFMGWVAQRNDTYGLGDTPLAVYQAWSRKVVAESGTNPTVVPPPARVGDIPPGFDWTGQLGADAMTATGEARVALEGLSSQATTPGANQANSTTLGITRAFLPMPTQWGYLASLINGTETISPEQLGAEATEEQISAQGNAMSMQRMVMCNENQVAPNPADIPSYAWSNFVTGDIFTAPNSMFTSGAACSGIAPVTGMPALDGSQLDTRPMQIQGTGDPQTPYAHHHFLSETMNSQLVTVHGNGHGQVATGNQAVDDAVVEYLRTGQAPTADLPGISG